MYKIFTALSLLMGSLAYSQVSLPIDFESSVVTGDFVDFDGGVASVVANPVPGGLNTSATVAQIVRNGGQPWSGSKLSFAGPLDFSSQNSISMKVYTTAPAGTQIKLKLEGGATTFEVDAVTKTSGQWEVLVWNFELAPSDETVLVFMFDFGFVGDGTSASTFLFDDIQYTVSTATLNFPLDFEGGSTVSSDFVDFDGGKAAVVANPSVSGINTSSAVGRIIRNGGQVWAGSKLIFNGVNFDFTTTGYFVLKIYTAAPVGTPIKLKLEGSASPVDIDVNTTVTNEWETLVYNFTGQPSLYNTLVFMPDIGTLGDGGASSIFYYDDIEFKCVASSAPTPDQSNLATINANCKVTSLTAPTATDECGNSLTGTHNVSLPLTTLGQTIVIWTYEDANGNTVTQNQEINITCSVGIHDQNADSEFKMYPNPTADYLIIETQENQAIEYSLYNSIGELILRGNLASKTGAIDVSFIEKGLYVISINGTIKQFVKN